MEIRDGKLELMIKFKIAVRLEIIVTQPQTFFAAIISNLHHCHHLFVTSSNLCEGVCVPNRATHLEQKGA